MPLTHLVADQVLDALFGAQANFSEPATYFIAATTVTITKTMTGTTITEPSGNGYARVSFTNNKTNWTTSSTSALSNAVQISFPAASGGTWGTILDLALTSASSNGDLIGYGTLDTSFEVVDGAQLVVNINDWDITYT